MDCSIIIVNWNAKDLLSRCLEAVAAQDLGLKKVEVFVVDNASVDGSQRHINELYPWVKLIQNAENLGFACANNLAIHASAGEYILLLNSDAFLSQAALSRLIDCMDADPSIAILGPQLIYPDGRLQRSYGSLPGLRSEVASLFGLDKVSILSRYGADLDGVIETGWVSGACMLIRRQVLNQIGLLDEDFFFFSEEVDLCARAGEAGWVVAHDPRVKVVHVEAGSSGITVARILNLYRAKIHYFRKHQTELKTRLLIFFIWIATIAKAFYYSILSILDKKIHLRAQLWLSTLRRLNSLQA